MLYGRRWWDCSTSLLCVHGRKTLYILYLWGWWEWMKYLPTLCMYYTCGDGENECNTCLLCVCIIPAAMVRMNAILAYCVQVLYLWRWLEWMQYLPTVCKYYTCGDGENECNTCLLCVCIIPAAMVKLQYQPTVCSWTKTIYYTCGDGETAVCSWTKKSIYTCGEGETAVPAYCVSMDKKNYIYYTWGEGENTVRTSYYVSMEQKLLV